MIHPSLKITDLDLELGMPQNALAGGLVLIVVYPRVKWKYDYGRIGIGGGMRRESQAL